MTEHAPAIAIVGLGGVFPGGPGLDGFWSLVVEGRDAFLDKRTPNWDAFPYYY